MVPNIVVPRILIRLERRVNGLHQPLRRGTSSSIRVPVIDSPSVTSGLLIQSTQDGVSQRQGEPLIGKDLFHEAAPPLHTPPYRTVISGLVALSLDKADHLILHPIECGLRELTHRPGSFGRDLPMGSMTDETILAILSRIHDMNPPPPPPPEGTG